MSRLFWHMYSVKEIGLSGKGLKASSVNEFSDNIGRMSLVKCQKVWGIFWGIFSCSQLLPVTLSANRIW